LTKTEIWRQYEHGSAAACGLLEETAITDTGEWISAYRNRRTDHADRMGVNRWPKIAWNSKLTGRSARGRRRR